MSARGIPENPILLIDDEQPVNDSLSLMLRSNGIDNIVACTDSREAMAIHEEMPQVPVIVVTGSNEASAAVECMKAGAFDYMVKAVVIRTAM